VLIWELHGTCNGLSEGKSRGLGLDMAQLIPSFLGHVLSDEAVLGLDLREGRRGWWKSVKDGIVAANGDGRHANQANWVLVGGHLCWCFLTQSNAIEWKF